MPLATAQRACELAQGGEWRHGCSLIADVVRCAAYAEECAWDAGQVGRAVGGRSVGEVGRTAIEGVRVGGGNDRLR